MNRWRSQSSGSIIGRSSTARLLPVRLSWINRERGVVASTASGHSAINCCRFPLTTIARHSTRVAGLAARRSTIFQPGASRARVVNELPDAADQAISVDAVQPDWLRSIRARTSAASDRCG